jgi:hypothetical protein
MTAQIDPSEAQTFPINRLTSMRDFLVLHPRDGHERNPTEKTRRRPIASAGGARS